MWAFSLWLIGMGMFILYTYLPAWLAAYLTVMDKLLGREVAEIHKDFDPFDVRRSLLALAALACVAVGCILLGAFIIAAKSGLAPDWWYEFEVGQLRSAGEWWRIVLGWH